MTLVDAATGFIVWFAGGSLLGFVVGYAIKKVAKIVAVIVGAFVLGVMYLSYAGIARIDWQRAEQVSRNAAYNASQQVATVVNNTAQQMQHQADMSTLPVVGGVGFFVGFLYGLKKG